MPEDRLSSIVAALPASVPFVAPEAIERRLGRAFELRLGANESPFGPSPESVQAMKLRAESVHNYGDPESWTLRDILALELGIQPNQIVVGAGIDGLLRLLAQAYCDPGDAVVTTFGSYPTFEYAALGIGARILSVPYRNDALDFDALGGAARAEKVKLVYVANPDNPSGSWQPVSAIWDLARDLPETVTLVLDEAYAEFAPESVPARTVVDQTNFVLLRTFSKAHGMAGGRIAYAIGAEEAVGPLNRIRMHFEVSSVAQAGAEAALLSSRHVAMVVSETALGRQEYSELALSLGFTPLPSHTNFVTIDVGSNDRAAALVDRLAKNGVFIRMPGKPPLNRCVRVTIGTVEQRIRFAQVLRELAQC